MGLNLDDDWDVPPEALEAAERSYAKYKSLKFAIVAAIEIMGLMIPPQEPDDE